MKKLNFPLKIDEEKNEVSVDTEDLGVTVRIPKKYSKYVGIAKWIMVLVGFALATYGYSLIVP